MSQLIPNVGEIPENAIPLIPGEKTDGGVKHYRSRETKSPLCGGVPSENTAYARKWDDVNCDFCLEVKPTRGRKNKTGEAKSEERPKKSNQKKPNPQETGLAEVISGVLNVSFYHARLPPAPPQLVMPWAQSVVRCFEHYGLMEYADHPLGAAVVSSAILFMTVKDFEPIDDDEALNLAHGIVAHG